jgi:hypothetical protein
VCVCGGGLCTARARPRAPPCPAVPRRRARANGGASALLPAAAASCARNSQGRRATVRVGVHARRGAGEGGARRAAHMFRAPPPEARGVAARGNRAAIPRAGASLRCTHSCGALCCRPGRAREEPVTYRGLRNTCVQVCAPCLPELAYKAGVRFGAGVHKHCTPAPPSRPGNN